MKFTRILATGAAAAAITAGFTVVAVTAQADDSAITCYEVGFDHLPGASASTNPPRVTVDDGDPYVRSYPCFIS